jgi:NodT family efflux transporter outer membrane factor (OMF) lipoprotein
LVYAFFACVNTYVLNFCGLVRVWQAMAPPECNRITIFIFLFLSTFLSGCFTIGPNYTRPETKAEPEWLEAGDPRVKTDPGEYRNWWKVFKDPFLNRLIDTAYHENLDLRQAGVRILEARAQLGVATGQFYPQTQQLSGSGQRIRESAGVPIPGTSISAPRFVGVNYWQVQLGLSGSWELDFWGKYRRSIQSADASMQASIADYDNALVSLVANVANFYTAMRTLERRLDIANKNVESQTESLTIARVRFEGGTTSERDVEQARTVLTSTQATIPVLQLQLRQAKDAISVLLGMPPNRLKELEKGNGKIPTPPATVVAGIPAELLRRRPDIRAAEYNAIAQCALIGVAKADLLPAFSLTGNFGTLSSDVGANKLGDVVNWRNATTTLAPTVQWNILNYGRIINNVRVQDARFQELLINYQNTVLKAQQDVEDNMAAFLRSQEQAKALTENVDAAQKSLNLAMIQYREGITDFTTVLTAQVSLLNAQDNLANAIGNIASGLVGVYRALGGGWEIREGQNFVPVETRLKMENRTNWDRLMTPPSLPPPEPEEIKPKLRAPDW